MLVDVMGLVGGGEDFGFVDVVDAQLFEICASAKWPMAALRHDRDGNGRHDLSIFLGEAMRATPPSARICAGTRSSAMTATAPAFSAISACLASVTSMMTPPLSISARPVFRRRLVEFPFFDPLVSDMMPPSLLMNRQRNALAVLTLRTRAAFISLPPLSDDTAFLSLQPGLAQIPLCLTHGLSPWTSLLRRLRGYFEASLGGFSHATHYY